MKSECDHIRDLIADSVAGVLVTEQAESLDEHLQRCTDCRRYAEALRHEDQLLMGLVAGVTTGMPARREQLLQVMARRACRRASHRITWRTMIRNPVARLTAAGIIVAAVILATSYFNGVAVKAVELTEIVKAVGQVPWMHASAVAEGSNVTGTTELWIGFAAKVHGEKMPNGKVSFHRFQEHERAEYDPNSHTITLSYAQESALSVPISSPLLVLESMQKMLEQHGAEMVVRMGDYQGRKVQVQELALANHFQGISLYTTKLYVDPQSRLLCAMEATVLDTNGVVASSTQATYDYPPMGPRDIYDLGVPRDVKVVNNMPAHELRRVLEQYRQIRDEATRQYIAVIAHNTAVNITDAVNMIDVDYKSGRQHRQERHSVFDEGQSFRDTNDPAWGISRQRLGDTFASMLAWSRSQVTQPGKTGIEVHLYDGEYDCSLRKDPRNGWGQLNRRYSPDSSLGPQNALGDLAWPQIPPDAQIVQDDYATEHKLICFERLQQGSVSGRTVSLPGRFLYYLDPAWGYLCRRRVTEWRPDADWQKDKDWLADVDPKETREGSITVEQITEAAQAPNGYWYPRAIVVQGRGVRKDYRQAPLETYWSKRIYLNLSPEFPEGIFDSDKLPGR